MREDDNNDIQAQAAAWVAREDRAPLPAGQRQLRDAWLAADRRHLGAYARAHAMLAAGSLRSVSASAAAAPLPPPRRRIALAGGLAAALVLAATGLAMLQESARRYATARGEVLRVSLEDGSVAILNADTRLRVRYRRDRREIELERGEALFDVAKQRQRPFVVHAAGTAVTAVGTSFSVSLPASRQGQVEVLVREGVVDVAERDEAIPPARLPANHRALASRGDGIRIESVSARDVGAALAWREGMLAFNGDTLSVAAARFLRYSELRIVIDDPRVGGMRVVGLYAANDPDGFARSVALSLGLVVERRAGAIHLRARSGHGWPPPLAASAADAPSPSSKEKQ